MTQAQLAEEMKYRGFDFHQQTVYRIESGKRKVTVGEALALSELVEVPLDVLAARSEDSLQRRRQTLRFMARQTVQYIEEVAAAAEEAKEKQSELRDSAALLDKITTGTDRAIDGKAESWVEHYRPIFDHPVARHATEGFEDLLWRLDYDWVDDEWKRGPEDGER
ncbi:hypothetical protein GCM10009792_20580 [Microcella alkalica]